MSPAVPRDDVNSQHLGHLELDPPADSAQRLRRAIRAAVGIRLEDGNSVSVLRNGVEIFPAMLEAVTEARHSIDFQTFIYWTGDIAKRFANALSERSRAGVRVRVVLDSFGSRPMRQELIEQMMAAGVMVERFRPVIRGKFWESDHRTHRKILIVDDKIGFTGGVGIASEWEGDARNPHEWRDTHFRVEGPSVLRLKASFLTDWRDTGHVLDPTDLELDLPEKAGQVELAVIDGSAQIGFDDTERVLEALISEARQRILIATPYFNPSEAVQTLITRALTRGVNLDLLVPGPHIDKRVSQVMAEEMYLPLIDAGARVWIYQPTMMHVKAMLVDGSMALVGSININRRSVEKDEEVAVAIFDRELTSLLESHFQDDVARSIAAAPEIRDRPVLRRIAARLLRPIRSEM